jgi:hypothetical protein
MKKTFLTGLLLLVAFFVCGQVNPQAYYTFDLTNPLSPTIGSTTLTTTGTYSIGTGGQVGKYLIQNNTTAGLVRGATVPVSGAITIEMIWKADFRFYDNRDPVIFTIGNINARFDYPNIKFFSTTTSGASTINDNMTITLNGANQSSWSYYTNGWHHFVFVVNAAAGIKQIYVDGVLPSGFSKPISTGLVSQPASAPITFGSGTTYSKAAQFVDEVAIYNQAITGGQVRSNYLNFVAGQHYAFGTTTTVAAPAQTTGLDITDFPLGYILGSSNSSSVTNSVLDQLQSYQPPRFSDNVSAPNFNWSQINYVGGYFQPGVSEAQAAENAGEINYEMAKYWNYYFMVNPNINNTSYLDTNKFAGKYVAISNRNRDLKTSVISFQTQFNPSLAGLTSTSTYLKNQNLPANYYLRTSAGAFILNGSNKYLSPAAPLDSIKNDARYFKNRMQLLANVMTDTLNIVNENDEVVPMIDSVRLRQDPAVIARMALLSFGKANDMLGFGYYTFGKLLIDSMRSITPFANTAYTQYRIDGQDGTNGRNFFEPAFKERRKFNSDPNYGQCSTYDFYPRWPYNWRFNISAFRGIQPMVEARNTEIALGNRYFTPFITGGYDVNEENNMRPAQYLGLLKIVSMYGARSFYTAYFNEQSSYNPPNPPPAVPKGYAWQLALPTYAQASVGWVMSDANNDSLLTGDMPDTYVNRTGFFYGFYGGNNEILTTIRKRLSGNVYNIATALEKYSNQQGNGQLTDTATVTVDSKALTFLTRRQGSVYTVDLSKDTAVFIQYDGWHESTHPERWSKDIPIEAEQYGAYVSRAKDVRSLPYQASSGGTFNFLNTTTYLTYRDSTTYSRDTLSYKFSLRTDTTLYVWIRMRSINGTNAGVAVRMDNGTAFTQNLVRDTTWRWYRISIVPDTMKYRVLEGNHTFKVIATSARTEIDQYLLTPNAATSLPEGIPGVVNPCTTVVTPTLTPNDTVDVCSGSTLVITSSLNSSYLWNTGATTRSITVTTEGNYTVTTTDPNGCTATSLPTFVDTISCPCTLPDTLYTSAIRRFNAEIRWTAVTGATTYIVTIQDTRTGLQTRLPWSSGTLRVVAKNLVPSRKYKVDIQTVCGSTFTNYKTIYFVTLPR